MFSKTPPGRGLTASCASTTRSGAVGESKTSRLLDFAENLFNLQNIDGFDDRVNRLRADSMIESTFAEFDFARFLYIHDIDFKFVVPCGVAGKDYDYRIRYADGREVCADAKCRLEGTQMRADTIVNALKKARSNNLPHDEPGAVFVKVPASWLEDEVMRRGRRDGSRVPAQHAAHCVCLDLRRCHDRAEGSEDDVDAAPFPGIRQSRPSV